MSTLNQCICGLPAKAKYCSKTCYGFSKLKNPLSFICKKCGIEFPNLLRMVEQKYCSKECRITSRTKRSMVKGPDMRGKNPPPMNHPWRQYKETLV